MAPDRFEQDLVAGLRRLADEARPSPDARERLHRRVRREPARRLGIVVVSYAMVVVVAVAAFVGVRLRDRDRDVAGLPRPSLTSAATPGTSTTSTMPPTPTTTAPATTGAPVVATPPASTIAPGAGFADTPRVRERSPQPVPRVVRLEVGRHDDEGFDRVVVAFDGPLPGYDIRYVDQVVQDGSGQPVTLLGGADLQVVIKPANAHDDTGAPTLPVPRLTPAFAMVQEARLVGDFEAVVTVGVGVRARAPFRVIELTGPNRLVIDVQHR
jgi:hypothetical protein